MRQPLQIRQYVMWATITLKNINEKNTQEIGLDEG